MQVGDIGVLRHDHHVAHDDDLETGADSRALHGTHERLADDVVVTETAKERVVRVIDRAKLAWASVSVDEFLDIPAGAEKTSGTGYNGSTYLFVVVDFLP